MKRLRILLVEDDVIIGMLLGVTLEQMGHVVCSTETTEAGAVEAAARIRPDLMIVDAGLRSGDGVSAVEQVLRAGPMPHLFASGDLSSVKARLPSAVVIQKPFQEAELALAIQSAMAGSLGPRVPPRDAIRPIRT